MNEEHPVLSGINRIAQAISAVIAIVTLVKIVQWMWAQGAESWRTKDSAYRADCIVLPIAAVVLGVGLLGLGILWILCPEFRS